VVAIATAPDGTELGRSAPLWFDGDRHGPSGIRPDLVSGQVVGRFLSLSGYVDRNTTGMTVSVDGQSVWSGP
jgi:hypothetical protein